MNITKKKIILSLFFPILFIAVLWIIKLYENTLDFSLVRFGIYPREAKGLWGILLSTFIHADFNHLINNSLALLILGTITFYFYNQAAPKVILFCWIVGGIFLWIFGRSAWHIGASGIVYSLVAFLFFSGVFRRYTPLMAISLFVVFVYGSLVWGMLPIDHKISWEGHLAGFISGIVMAWRYRKIGPVSPPPFYEREDYEDEDFEKSPDSENHQDLSK